MAYSYSLETVDGRVVNFESPEQLTRQQAEEIARYRIYEEDQQRAQLEQTASSTRGLGEFVTDTGKSLGQGLMDIGSGAVGLMQLLGYDPKEATQMREAFERGREDLQASKSEKIRAQEQLFGETEGFWDTAAFLAQNPMYLADMGVAQVPQLAGVIAPAGRVASAAANTPTVARALTKVLTKDVADKVIAKAGTVGAVAAGGGLNASDVGMETYDRVLEQLLADGVDEKAATEQAMSAAREDAAIAATVTLGTSALIPGGTAIERAVIGTPAAKQIAKEITKQAVPKLGKTKATAIGALGEGGQEFAEEASGQLLSNISAIQAGAEGDVFEGVGKAGATGFMLGAGLGGPSNLVNAYQTQKAAKKLNERLEEARQATEAAVQKQEAEEAERAARPQLGYDPGYRVTFPDGTVSDPVYNEQEAAAERARWLSETQRGEAPQVPETVDRKPAPRAPVVTPTTAPTGAPAGAQAQAVPQVEDIDYDFDVDTLKEKGALPKKGKRYTEVASKVANLDFESDAGRAEAEAYAVELENVNTKWAPKLSSEIKARLAAGPAAPVAPVDEGAAEVKQVAPLDEDTKLRLQEKASALVTKGGDIAAAVENVRRNYGDEGATIFQEAANEVAKGPTPVRGVPGGKQKVTDDGAPTGEGVELVGVKSESGTTEGAKTSETAGVGGRGLSPVRDAGRAGAISSALDEFDADIVDKTSQFMVRNLGGGGATAQVVREEVTKAVKDAEFEISDLNTEGPIVDAKIDAAIRAVSNRLKVAVGTDEEGRKIETKPMRVPEAVKTLKGIVDPARVQADIANKIKANKRARQGKRAPLTPADTERLIGAYVAEKLAEDTVTKAVSRLKAELSKPSMLRSRVRAELEQAQRALSDITAIKRDSGIQKGVAKEARYGQIKESADRLAQERREKAGEYSEKSRVSRPTIDTLKKQAQARIEREERAKSMVGPVYIALPRMPTLLEESGGKTPDKRITTLSPRQYQNAIYAIEKSKDFSVRNTRDVEQFNEEDSFGLQVTQDQVDQETNEFARDAMSKQLRRKAVKNGEKVLNYVSQADIVSDEEVERLTDALEIYQDETATTEEMLDAKDIINEFVEEHLDAAEAWKSKQTSLRANRMVSTPQFDSAEELRAVLERKFDKDALDAGIRSGRVVLLDSMNDPRLDRKTRAAVEAGAEQGAVIGGFVHPNAKAEPVVYLVASNINPNETLRVLVHEAGVHAGWRGVMGDQSYMQAENFIRQAIRRVEKQGRPLNKTESVIYEAYRRVKTDYKISPSEVMEEVLAHVVDQHTDIPFYKRLINSIMNWLKGIGFLPKSWKQAIAERNVDKILFDLSDIAHSAAKNWMLRDAAVNATREGPMLSAKTGQDFVQATVESGGVIGEPESPKTVRDRAKKLAYKEVDGKMVRMTVDDYRASGRRWMDEKLTKIVSADAAAQREARRRMREMPDAEAEIIGRMLEISTSQTFHAEGVASNFLEYGNITYDEKLYKWRAVDDDANFASLMRAVEAFGKSVGLDPFRAQRVLHRYLEMKRLKSLYEDTRKKQRRLDELKTENKASSAEYRKLKKLLKERKLHVKESAVDALLKNYEGNAEAAKVVEIWNKMRKNAVDVMVQGGLLTEEKAEAWLDNVDYVPFQRVKQIEDKEGLPDFISGIKAEYQDKRMKGSENEVNDIFDNMAKWVEYSVEAAVRNHSGVRLMNTMIDLGMAQEVTAAHKVDIEEYKRGKVEMYMEGKKRTFVAQDPLFIEAFKGQEGLGIPYLKQASWFTNFLRKSVVLNPIFSIGQLTQDAFGAMFTSGLSPMQAIKIPYYVIKEFIKTLRGTSEAHDFLKRFASVGTRDYSAAVVVNDIESRLSKSKYKSGWKSLLDKMENFSMASDNAVRQAVYSLSIADGTSQAEAVERSFEIINFRRKGSSPIIHGMARMIPFFNAWLQALNVQASTLTGEGISPKNEASRTRLYQNLGMATAMMMLYAMMMGGDEDYEELDPMYRDRMLMIPGMGGFGLPLRTDLFLLPKIIAEHSYRLMTDNAMEDGRTFRDALATALVNGVASPMAVPQILKPMVEVAIDRNFFTGRPLVSQAYASLPAYLQQTEYTSELANFIGDASHAVFGGEGLSPIKVDQLIRGYFGSVGGALLWTSNLLGDYAGIRPSRSIQDYAAALPGFSRFLNREEGSGMRSYFYEMSRDVNMSYKEYLELQKYRPEDLDPFLADDENAQRVAMAKAVRNLSNRLNKIRAAIRQISKTSGDSEEKEQMISDLRQLENEILSGMNLKEMRAMAGRGDFF
jgi:hypothetical protein